MPPPPPGVEAAAPAGTHDVTAVWSDAERAAWSPPERLTPAEWAE
ncbi:MAG: hypothetical protein JWO31_1797, partial [Phycisphaerales bacterium]|nr:hypothetical protein [Phycisphaerales bacterium]